MTDVEKQMKTIDDAIAELDRLRARNAKLLSVLTDIAEHPGPNADEAASWRADLARAAVVECSSDGKAQPC